MRRATVERPFKAAMPAFVPAFPKMRAECLALGYLAYNFIKVDGTLRTSPAMTAGVTDRLWEVSGLVALWESGRKEGRKSGVNFDFQPLSAAWWIWGIFLFISLGWISVVRI